MHILLLKTSSLGDIVHSFPALTDAARVIPGLRVDWVVEEAFADLPPLHPAVERVIPVAMRRWRRSPFLLLSELPGFISSLRHSAYDLVLDAQGLLVKSALPALLARGPVAGFDARSAREGLSARCYRYRYHVPRDRHAIDRIRDLFAAALAYSRPDGVPDSGLDAGVVDRVGQPYLVFLHGTTWDNKLWPEDNWMQLCREAIGAGYRVRLLWGDDDEKARAGRLAVSGAELEPRCSLPEIIHLMRGAVGVIGVDSGLTHLAAALDRPTLGLYGPTNARLTGVKGRQQRSLASTFGCAPCLRRECSYRGESEVWPACFGELDAGVVWRSFCELLQEPVVSA